MSALLYWSAVKTSLSIQNTDIYKWLIPIKLCCSIYSCLAYSIARAAYKLLGLCTFNVKLFMLCHCRFKWCLNNVNTLLYMKCSRLSILQTIIVIYTICNITVLLSLKNQSSTLNCMNTAWIDLEEITLLYRNLADKFFPALAADHLFYFLVILCIVTDHDSAAFFCIKNIPALHLAKRAILILCCVCVIWMNLNAKICLCINNLNQKREAVSLYIAK